MITTGDIMDIVFTLQNGIATVKLVELAIDNDGGERTYIDALEGATVLLRDVENRLTKIVKEVITNENNE